MKTFNKIAWTIIAALIAFLVFSDMVEAIREAEPNHFLTGESTGVITPSDTDPNLIIWATTSEIEIWKPQVYKCPKHGDVTGVISIYDDMRTESMATCIQCFLDVFPPLELAVTE